jgi:2-oxoglutarate ferredoxin oxidoreductase subunit alpha
MMEPAELPPLQEPRLTRPEWALTGAKGRSKRIITSLYLDAEALEQVNRRLQAKIERIKADETRYEAFMTADADVLLVAFGTMARIAKSAIRDARREGIHIGLLRPITLSPFPFAPLEKLSRQVQAILVVEMNAGQMVEDVRLGVGDRVPVRFFGHTGGVVPLPDEIMEQIVMMERQLISLDSVLYQPYEPVLALMRGL